jgi:hypothetical protein
MQKTLLDAPYLPVTTASTSVMLLLTFAESHAYCLERRAACNDAHRSADFWLTVIEHLSDDHFASQPVHHETEHMCSARNHACGKVSRSSLILCSLTAIFSSHAILKTLALLKSPIIRALELAVYHGEPLDSILCLLMNPGQG